MAHATEPSHVPACAALSAAAASPLATPPSNQPTRRQRRLHTRARLRAHRLRLLLSVTIALRVNDDSTPPLPRPAAPYDSLGAVQPIVFGYLAEASAGACDLIKSVADELAPRYADLYLLESVEAAVGIATDRLREEIGAAVFKAQARVILDRIRYCYRGNRAADARRHLQQARWRSRAEHARSHGRPRGRYSLLHRRP